MTDAAHIGRSILGARAHLAENPAKARSTDSAATAVLAEGLLCRIEGPNGASIVTDMPRGVGGNASAPSPGWYLRAAHAACDATAIAMRAAELGIPLRRVEVVVDSTSDSRGVLGGDDSVPAGPLGTRIAIRIDAGEVDESVVREVVEWADRHSYVSEALRRSIPLDVHVETTAGSSA